MTDPTAREPIERLLESFEYAVLGATTTGDTSRVREKGTAILMCVRALQSDADRYRWLRDATRMVDGSVEGMLTIHAIHDDAATSEIRDDLDAAIDAALSREAPHG